MKKTKKLNDLIYDIRYQLAPIISTWSKGSCGHDSRGGKVCVDCLKDDLAKLVGKTEAKEFVYLTKSVNKIIGTMTDKLGGR